MAEYIEREALLDDFKNDLLCCQFGSALKGTPRSEIEIKNVLERIEDAPAEDVAPVVHGRWVMSVSSHALECSECGMRIYAVMNYCPNCGAKMDLECET